MNAALRRLLLAEFAGTTPPLIFGVRAVVAALGLGHRQLDHTGLGIIALFVPVIAAAVYMPGPTSGAHINPAVTCSLAVVALVGAALAARTSEVIAQPRRAAAAAAQSPQGRQVLPEDERRMSKNPQPKGDNHGR